MKLAETRQNKVGTWFGVEETFDDANHHNDTARVWKLCSNYCPHIRGNERKTWRVHAELPWQEGWELYYRRLNGTQL